MKTKGNLRQVFRRSVGRVLAVAGLAWGATGPNEAVGGTGQVCITLLVNVFGATEAYSLVNTWCGQPGPTAYAWLVFTGSAGASYTKYLVGGVDICDYNLGPWENDITSANTINVFACPSDNWGNPGRLDMQQIPLPPEFATQTLTTIQFVDNGGPVAPVVQRSVLDGLTVQATTSWPPAIEGNASQIKVTWLAAIGATLQANSNLSTINWTDYGGSVTNHGGTNSVTLAPPPEDNLFFRLRQP